MGSILISQQLTASEAMSVEIKGLNKSTSFGPLGYGTMSLTWRPDGPVPDEQAFQALMAAMAHGKTHINAGEFYGLKDRADNLKLLSRFFAKYPEYTDKCFLSVKGALDFEGGFRIDCSPEGLRKSVDNILQLLDGKKRLDLFEPARLDSTVSIEDTMKNLKILVEEGKFDYIGLSECSAATIRRAHAIAPVSLLEEEYSPFSVDIEKNGVLSTCKELGIPIAAYSPIGRGILSGNLKLSDLPEGDGRTRFDRFQPENWEANQQLVRKFVSIAEKKNIAPSTLALAWVLRQYPGGLVAIPGSTRPHIVTENFAALEVEISEEDDKAVREATAGVKGGRYNEHMEKYLSM